MRILRELSPERYWIVLFAQIFLIVLATFIEHHFALYILFALALLWILGTAIAAIWKSFLPRVLALLTGFIAFFSGFVWVEPHVSGGFKLAALIVCGFSYSVFILIAIIAMIKNVFVREGVTAARIVGSICIYLLIGMFFAFLYATLDLINPAAFNLGSISGESIETFREYLYFSYITLTTIGFGDMLPTLPLSRLFSLLEGLIGPIYLAIMVASLVGMHVSQASKKNNK